MLSGLGFVAGIISNLVTNGSKAAIDIWRGKAEAKEETARWERERAQMQWEAEHRGEVEIAIAEREESVAIERTQQARIKESGDLQGASQWVVNLTKSVRPILSYLIIFQYMLVTGWGVKSGLISWEQIIASVGLLAEAVVGFYFSDRVFRKKHTK